MSSEKYIGLVVHQATISVAVMDGQGKVVMESILETLNPCSLGFWGCCCATADERRSAYCVRGSFSCSTAWFARTFFSVGLMSYLG